MVRNGRNPTGNSRRGRNRNATSVRRIRRMITRVETGVQFVPPLDPPTFAAAPWWPITLNMTVSSETVFSYNDLHTGLVKAVGLDKIKDSTDATIVNNYFQIRPVSVRVWGLSRQVIRLGIYEILSTGLHRLKTVTDSGTPINYSRLGWRFGVAARIDPNANEGVKIFSVAGDLATDKKAYVMVQILFCIRDVPAATGPVPGPITTILYQPPKAEVANQSDDSDFHVLNIEGMHFT